MDLNEVQLETYTSMEVSLTAKGTAQWCIKAKYPTPEATREALEKGIKMLREEIAKQGLKEAGI
ncbi:MAG: hypothetical protein MJZ37_00150 [Bacilli bacterium]|nr:hypothetical protein [Bacilli bacterium]